MRASRPDYEGLFSFSYSFFLPHTPFYLSWYSCDTPITFRDKECTILVTSQIYHRHIIVLYRTVISLCHHCDITVISLWYIWNVTGVSTDADRNVCNGFKREAGCFFWKKAVLENCWKNVGKCSLILIESVQLCGGKFVLHK